MEEQDILSYGIGMTTLEEVFMKCNRAEGDDETDQIKPETSKHTSIQDKKADEKPMTASETAAKVATEAFLLNDN